MVPLIEWYDFYLFALVLPFPLAAQFFRPVQPTSAFHCFACYSPSPLASLCVRLARSSLGESANHIGRKYTFPRHHDADGVRSSLGPLPSRIIGVLAPIILDPLRSCKASHSAVNGVATYVSEHAPQGKRGLYTSWIQTTATVGLFMALLLVLGIRTLPRRTDFRRLGYAFRSCVGHPVLRSFDLILAQAQ